MQTLNVALIHSSALPIPPILVSKSSQLHSWNKLFHSFLVHSIFIRLCGAPQLLSLWRGLMNVLGSHPLIIPALKAFRYTLYLPPPPPFFLSLPFSHSQIHKGIMQAIEYIWVLYLQRQKHIFTLLCRYELVLLFLVSD